MDTHQQIEQSAAQAVKVIAQAAEAATKTIATAAAEAVKVTNAKTDGDHDAIVEIKTMQQVMLSEIREIKDGTASRIACLEAEKLDVKDSYPVIYRKSVEDALEDHEKRIRHNSTTITRIVSFGTAAMIALGVIEFLVSNYLKFGKL